MQVLERGVYATGRTRSTPEDGFLSFLEARRLPAPVLNYPIEVEGRTYEADTAWPDKLVIAEVDDLHSHGTEFAFESDRVRDRALLLAGWRTIRVTRNQLRSDPDGLERDLRALLGLPR
jgi:very-short-patch-repair endonuclease